MEKRIGLSKIAIEETKMTKRLKGLYRINSDLISIEEMIQSIFSVAQKKNYFNDYQGIIITYRKSFQKNDERGVELTMKHLLHATKEEKELHKRLIDLGNKYVAHSENDEYDKVDIGLIIENSTGQAIRVDVTQTMFELLGLTDFKTILALILSIKQNLSKEIENLENAIIDEYNCKVFIQRPEQEMKI